MNELPHHDRGAPSSERPHKVWISRLQLSGFRNYSSLVMEFDDAHVVLAGENGAGKTNLLEALSFLSPGRGLRRATYQQIANLAMHGPPTWTVNARICHDGFETVIGTGVFAEPGTAEMARKVRINQSPARSGDELLEHLKVIWLTPAMDGLFSGPGSDRRRFVDRMVLSIDPAHGRRVADFERAMRSRNRLLEHRQPDASWLDAIEQQMAELATAIAGARVELVSLLKAMIERSHGTAFPQALVALEGELEQAVATGAASAAEDQYQRDLKQHRARDRAAGRCLAGPHRSNLVVRHGPKDMEAHLCSTGEQKALLVGLILAHARLTGELTGQAPLLLLDEVAAHLDPTRRAALFDLIDELGCQTWMTGTDATLFSALGERAQFFVVDSGCLTPAHSPQ